MTLLDGLQAYWKLDEVSGNRVDLISGAILAETGGSTSYKYDEHGKAADFKTGLSRYLLSANYYNYYPMSLMFHGSLLGTTATADLILLGNFSTGGIGWQIYLHGSDLKFQMAADGSNHIAGDLTGNRNANYSPVIFWLVMGSTLKMGLAGKRGNYTSVTGTSITYTNANWVGTPQAAPDTNTLRVGKGAYATYPSMLLSHLGIWNRVLTASELVQIINGDVYPFNGVYNLRQKRTTRTASSARSLASAKSLATVRPTMGQLHFTIGNIQLLTITTPDGTGRAVHPSVLYRPGGAAFGGYDWWMGFTPYANDTQENPCILASTDGYTWVVPAGISNPLDPDPGTPQHNSDTELVYWNGSLYLYYVHYINSSQTNLCRRSISSGMVVGDEEICISTSQPASPAIIIKDGLWYLLYRNQGTIADSQIAYSKDGLNWSIPKTIGYSDYGFGTSLGMNFWHPTIFNYHGRIFGLVAQQLSGTGTGAEQLYEFWIDDFESYQKVNSVPIITPTTPGITWSPSCIYRACFVDGSTPRIYFSTMGPTTADRNIAVADVSISFV
jgi:hypothetical protein